MKIKIEIEFEDVNHDEIEEVEDLTLYDSIDGWIDERNEWMVEAEWPYYEMEDPEL